MHSFLKLQAQILLIGGFLLLSCASGAMAQTPWQEESTSPQNDTKGDGEQEQLQERQPFVHGLSIGAGLAVYQGDFSRNPNHNVFKYLGTAKPSIELGVDHRFGQFDQFGAGADLIYSHISGATSGKIEFQNNILSLDVYGDYELPYVKLGLFRVFAGAGPMLLINPSYQNFPDDANGDIRWRPDLGTRFVGSAKFGVTIYGSVKIGTRITSTDLLDGYLGFHRDGLTDIVSFIKVSHRFDLR